MGGTNNNTHLILTCHHTPSLYIPLSHTQTHLASLMGRVRCLLDVAGRKQSLLHTDRQERKSKSTGKSSQRPPQRLVTDIKRDSREERGHGQTNRDLLFECFSFMKSSFCNSCCTDSRRKELICYVNLSVTEENLRRSHVHLQSEALSVVLNLDSGPWTAALTNFFTQVIEARPWGLCVCVYMYM